MKKLKKQWVPTLLWVTKGFDQILPVPRDLFRVYVNLRRKTHDVMDFCLELLQEKNFVIHDFIETLTVYAAPACAAEALKSILKHSSLVLCSY
ncbi:jg16902 [Pararge aegeria aegeria]|uniref:Jg16902 protein n=1 Tax=Pararge aegeria aegeria TaxID=348720 RepID=A0A8S4SPL8_9NEOP|nr:jg16902 [Pararge aegeria aegeria]